MVFRKLLPTGTLILISIFISNSTNVNAAEQNPRIQYLLDKAKARQSQKSSSTAQPNTSGSKVLSTRFRDTQQTQIKTPAIPETQIPATTPSTTLSTEQTIETKTTTIDNSRTAQQEALRKAQEERLIREQQAKEIADKVRAEKLEKERLAREAARFAREEKSAREKIAREAERKIREEKRAEEKIIREKERQARIAARKEEQIARELERKARNEKLAQEKLAKEAESKAQKEIARKTREEKALQDQLNKEARLKAKAEEKIAALTQEENTLEKANKIASENLVIQEKNTANVKEGVIEILDQNESLVDMDPLEIEPMSDEEDEDEDLSLLEEDEDEEEDEAEDEAEETPPKAATKAAQVPAQTADPNVSVKDTVSPTKLAVKEEVKTATEPIADAALGPRTDAERESDYIYILKKGLKSLEEDSWNDVKYNMKESLDYFNKEKKTYNDPKIDRYYKVALAFSKFSEAGLELDQGDAADFEEAESLYLDSQDILDDVQKSLDTQDPASKQISDTIGVVKKYINEELLYIEEMVGIE